MDKTVHIFVDSVELEGDLVVPPNAKGIIIFAHGSGSSRHSPRNNFVADLLRKSGFATLLFDLLTEKEDALYENRFNIFLLANRLKLVTRWIIRQPQTNSLSIGYFGASTGSAAALIAAADLGSKISAVVSRGGRPDLAGDILKKVKSPTLFIVGENDFGVIELNEEAAQLIPGDKKISIIPGATYLFEEPGALEEVARLATEWFNQYL